MRVILSRKGFDSAAGRCPSPIFPDGSLLSLPIPDKQSSIRYRDIQYADMDVGQLVSQLTGNPKRSGHFAHLDPDLRPEALARKKNWRPMLGQANSSQSHLRNQQVAVGDIFLFFGSFRPVERVESRWQFVRHEYARHVIWGWLQIGRIEKVDMLPATKLDWARYHPHFSRGVDPSNTLYIAADELRLRDRKVKAPGAGVLPAISDRQTLTVAGSPKQTCWKLPTWFFPREGRSGLSFHTNLDAWSMGDDHCLLKSVARGQEFVFNASDVREIDDWIESLIGVRD